MKERILIIGAGIAGLTTAYLLLEKGYDVVVIERDDAVGGLSRTYKYGEFAFDSGPHRFYTKNQKVIDFVGKVLQEDFVSMKMKSSVYILGKYYDWPLGIKVILKLPIYVMISAFFDMLQLMIKPYRGEINSFKDQILAKYGKTLYEIDFDPYTHKFTKIPTEQVHADWAKAGVNRAVIDEKIKMDSIFAVVKNTLFSKKENITIIYPTNGISDFSEKLKDKIQLMGGQVILNTVPTSLEMKDKLITKVICSNEQTYDVDKVVWTGTINEASRLLGVKKRNLEYLNIITYNLSLKGSPRRDDLWIYYVDDDVVFNRLYTTTLFSSAKAPSGCYGLCIEVTCLENSELLMAPEKLYDKIIENMQKTGLIKSKNEILEINHQLLKESYPIYQIDYRTELRNNMDDIFSTCRNINLAGRNGLFWYNNMDHSIENAFETTENIANDQNVALINEFWK